jgi:DNA-binding LacI/PurR family transcriptional regulator
LQKSGAYLSESGYNVVGRALDDGICFDAVQASNDQAAIGALKMLRERGLRVPEDVAICGFDNLFPSTLVSPAITTVDVPNYDMGAVAMRELLRRIEHPDTAPKSCVLDARIIVRASTRKDAVSQWDLTNW